METSPLPCVSYSLRHANSQGSVLALPVQNHTGDTVLCVSFALPRIVLSYGTLPKQTRDTVLSISRAVLGIDAIV